MTQIYHVHLYGTRSGISTVPYKYLKGCMTILCD